MFVVCVCYVFVHAYVSFSVLWAQLPELNDMMMMMMMMMTMMIRIISTRAYDISFTSDHYCHDSRTRCHYSAKMFLD